MRCFGTADAHEASVAFREKRRPVFQGRWLLWWGVQYNSLKQQPGYMDGV